jgi:CheY-like chemotaxis protein
VAEKVILLADDDPDDAEMFSFLLKEVDPSVTLYHVHNGSAVFDYFKEQQNPIPTVIFLDINMPEMTGWQCLTALKSNTQTKNIPVLIYSTSAHPRDKQIASDLGAIAFITKPSDYQRLKKLLTIITANLNGDIKHSLNNLE